MRVLGRVSELYMKVLHACSPLHTHLHARVAIQARGEYKGVLVRRYRAKNPAVLPVTSISSLTDAASSDFFVLDVFMTPLGGRDRGWGLFRSKWRPIFLPVNKSVVFSFLKIAVNGHKIMPVWKKFQ